MQFHLYEIYSECIFFEGSRVSSTARKKLSDHGSSAVVKGHRGWISRCKRVKPSVNAHGIDPLIDSISQILKIHGRGHACVWNLNWIIATHTHNERTRLDEIIAWFRTNEHEFREYRNHSNFDIRRFGWTDSMRRQLYFRLNYSLETSRPGCLHTGVSSINLQ